MVARTSREVLRWHESLYLTYPIIVPRWDLANGFTYAEILHVYFPNEINMLNFLNGRSLNCRLLNWAMIKQFLKKKNLPINHEYIDATLHRKDGGAEGLLEQTYELLTNKKPFLDTSYERNTQFTDHIYEQTLDYFQRSHTSKSIKNNLKISELITDPSYAHQAKKNEYIRDQLKNERQKLRLDNPQRFDIKPSLAIRCLRKPLQLEINPQDWYTKSFVSRSRSATSVSNKMPSTKQASRQISADRSKQNSKLQFQREKGTIDANENDTYYKEIILERKNECISNANDSSSFAMRHLILLGDSILDNGSYVRGQPAVIDQLKTKIKDQGWKATLLAVDGNVLSHIADQIKRVPDDATHLFISIGGNNALSYMHHLQQSVGSVGEALLILHKIKANFEKDYREMLKQVTSLKRPVTTCTIYNPRFPGSHEQTMCETGLSALNDVIVTESTKLGIPVIDLKTIFNDPKDYANAIEPGVQGGAKIVENILFVVNHHRFHENICSIYAKTKP
ncbi:hypothetical protein I4U23_028545 [Adineta vaga]|nr:hypothetical protein I4U23_028545 [Adineta vaga]